MIHTAHSYLGLSSQAEHLAKLRESMPVNKADPALMPPPSMVAEDAPPALACVQRGLWVAYCPAAGCKSGEILEPGTPFFCCVCANADIGYLWRPVLWPAEKGAIEAALDERAQPTERNWLPGESVAALHAEYRAARLRALGLELP